MFWFRNFHCPGFHFIHLGGISMWVNKLYTQISFSAQLAPFRCIANFCLDHAKWLAFPSFITACCVGATLCDHCGKVAKFTTNFNTPHVWLVWFSVELNLWPIVWPTAPHYFISLRNLLEMYGNGVKLLSTPELVEWNVPNEISLTIKSVQMKTSLKKEIVRREASLSTEYFLKGLNCAFLSFWSSFLLC